MRVLMGAFGTRGDIQPMLALARVLERRGHKPIFCIPPNFVEWARKFGVETYGVGMDIEKFIAAHGENILGSIPTLRKEIIRQADGMAPFAESADLILSSGICPLSSLFAERYHKPGRYVMFSPSIFPSDEHPAPLVPWQHLPRAVNRLSWRLEGSLWNLCLLGPLNEVRRKHGLSKSRDLWTSILGSNAIIASEPLLAAPPADYPIPYDQTGAWFFDDPSVVPKEVEAFLADGPAPLFIGFGSMTDSRREETMSRLLEGVRLAGVRAIIARGWAGFEASSSSKNKDVLIVGPTPHAQVFPRCAAVVHHAGAGTMHQTLRAGVPHIPAPHLLDQFFWSERLTRAGLSAATQSRARLSPAALAAAFRQCIEDTELKARCRDFAGRMRRDGVERMVGVIEALALG